MFGLEKIGFSLCLVLILIFACIILYYCKSKNKKTEHKVTAIFKLVTELHTEIEQLKSHSWPGNIRELKNTIERAVISSNSNKLNLNLAISDTTSISEAVRNDSEKSTDYLTSTEFKALEKANLYGALRAANWKTWGIGGAAELLGIKPSTLAYQMKQFGIEKPKAKA